MGRSLPFLILCVTYNLILKRKADRHIFTHFKLVAFFWQIVAVRPSTTFRSVNCQGPNASLQCTE